jgi:enoyl-CoA hydratase/carnithine racemase
MDGVRYETNAHVATITLDDPTRLNAITPEMHAQLRAALDTAIDDDQIRSVILTGTGRAFSSGGALGQETGGSMFDWLDFHDRFFELATAFRNSPKPVVVAVNGLCFGAALILVGYCDIVIAARSATFCFIEARMGGGVPGNLHHLVGPQWAKFLALTGEEISATRASRIGLILDTVEDDELAGTADAIATRIAAMPVAATRLNKRLLDRSLDISGWPTTTELTAGLMSAANTGLDEATNVDGERLSTVLRENGLRAFIQARDAAFHEPLLPEQEPGKLSSPRRQRAQRRNRSSPT